MGLYGWTIRKVVDRRITAPCTRPLTAIARRPGRCNREPTERAPTPRLIQHRSSQQEWGEPFPVVTSNSRNANIRSDRPILSRIHTALYAVAYQLLIVFVIQ
jgi:hypothetical protein